MKIVKTYGAEIEKPLANIRDGLPHKASQEFFKRLQKSSEKRKTFDHIHLSDVKEGVSIGVVSKDLGEQGLDNAYNNQETSLPYQTSLAKLKKLMDLDLKTVQDALYDESGTVINMAIHPLIKRDVKTYRNYVAPKGVYPYLWHRGWDHTAGIDARAQNSPATGVRVWDAADAVSVIIGAGAAMIGLFANSPYEDIKRSPYKEARLTMWDRMMERSKVPGDRETAEFPPNRFRTLAEYFNWMFGGNTGIHFVLAEQKGFEGNYKSMGDRMLLIDGNPSVLEFLSKKTWQASFFSEIGKKFNLKKVKVTPASSHMELMQFAQFAGARIRYGLKHQQFPVQDFVFACKANNGDMVEKIFEKYATYTYIEGRDPGSNFPDREIANAGKDIAGSVVIAPSAIQAGLLKNLKEAARFIDRFHWQELKLLREAAIKYGLQGKVGDHTVYDFTKKILEISAGGLPSKEYEYLRYPVWVLRTKKNGADRAIEFIEAQKQPLKKALQRLIHARNAIIT